MTNVLMPEQLTEKQISYLLGSQDFKENVADIACPECGGPQARHNENCPQCNGHGIVRITADVSPATAAALYMKAVELFQQE